MISVESRPARLRRVFRRRVLAHRRLLAALLAVVAVTTGVRAARAPAPPTVPVLTAVRDLPAGELLDADDLDTVEYAAGTAPSALSRDPVGETLAAPLRRGEPVTDVRLVGPGLTSSDPSLTAVPVRLPDAGMAALLDPGDRIDVVATDPQEGGSRVVAAEVTVLAVPPASAGGSGAVGASGVPGGALVVLGVRPDAAIGLMDAAVREYLSYVFAH